LRIEADFEPPEVAQHIGRDRSSVSRMETGTIPIAPEMLETLLTLYGVTDPAEREALLRFNRDAWRPGWWAGYAEDVEAALLDYVWLEEQSVEIQALNVVTFDGLLQTAEYARSLMHATNPDQDPDQVESWVALRMQRQIALTRAQPVRLHHVVSEAALRNLVGGPEVLVPQLRYILESCRRPNIDVRVLPFTSGVHIGGDFRIFAMPAPLDEIVCVDGPAGIAYLEPPGTGRLVAAYHRLVGAALDADESVALMASVADELETS
jgi:uncharacterized protein DUF5753/helix-turn-helix protein